MNFTENNQAQFQCEYFLRINDSVAPLHVKVNSNFLEFKYQKEITTCSCFGCQQMTNNESEETSIEEVDELEDSQFTTIILPNISAFYYVTY